MRLEDSAQARGGGPGPFPISNFQPPTSMPVARLFFFYVYSGCLLRRIVGHDYPVGVSSAVQSLSGFGFRPCSSPCLPCRVNWKIQLDEGQLRKIMSLCEQFLLDAAVLIFVFPLLDTVVQFGKEAITGKLVAGTLAISGVFFIWARILGMMGANGREKRT